SWLGECRGSLRPAVLLEHLDHQVRFRHAAEKVVPRSIHVGERRAAVRRPRLTANLEPPAVVEPVAASRWDDYLVRGDLAEVEVVRAVGEWLAEYRVDRCDAGD